MALSIPLPWLLGSLCATAASSILLKKKLDTAAGWRNLATAVIGVMLGESFTPEVLRAAITWWPSLTIMMIISLIFFWLSYAVTRFLSDADHNTNVLSSLPGGIALATAMSADFNADGKRVALAHFLRVTAVLFLAPVILAWNAVPVVPTSLPAASMTISGVELAILGAVTLVAFFLGGRANIPSGYLVIALVLSGFLHSYGVIVGKAPNFIAITAQVILGTSIGVRFGKYSISELVKDVWLSALIGLLLVVTTTVMAYATSKMLGIPFPTLFMAFLPGGIPEMGMLALTLDIDPAMVVSHHLARIVILLLLVQFMLRKKRMTPPQQQQQQQAKGG